MRVLIVKTSSLGDIVHTLPALTDAQHAITGLRCDWLAERAFAEIPAWHSAVDRIIRCDLRGWRGAPTKALFGGDWSTFKRDLHQYDYDLVIDAQGLVKSAWLASRANGPLAGPDWRSAREPLAASFYDSRYPVPKHNVAHAVERARILFAKALGYPLPGGDRVADAGLSPTLFPKRDRDGPYAVLLHGTTWASKRWPLADWCAVAASLRDRGIRVVLPWGNEAEKADAVIIANASRGKILPKSSLTDLACWLAHAHLCVGVDTGLAHLAAALGTPQITLYGPTQPELTGAVGLNQIWLRSGEVSSIDRTRPNRVRLAEVERALTGLLADADRRG